ncbi:hypothetical protein MLD38_009228 [Melastoma candidum]|uniref:Uncharacterized protein n=1 Tax=Melastoma candidum TaxID=119954 RepID=A0ACB9RW16_9MYRT|nr:hypothetical protein MLD38_009228 [Melastoma candidum]
MMSSILSPSATTSISFSPQQYRNRYEDLASLEQHCASMRDLRKIHSRLVKTGEIEDTHTASRLLAFCVSPAGDLRYARLLFDRIRDPNLFIWNTMIRGLSNGPSPEGALHLFVEMLGHTSVMPQRLTFPSLFKACSLLGWACTGSQLHGMVVKLGIDDDPYVRNTVLHAYVTLGLFEEARKVFDEDEITDVVACNCMVMGLAKCGEIDEARRLFDEMDIKSRITWNSMISGYVRNGRFLQAMELSREMRDNGIEPDEYTVVSLLNACAYTGSLRQGQWIHDFIKIKGINLNSVLVTALIDMYSRCGSIGEAYAVFQAALGKGLSCWNSMILGLARNNHEEEAIALFLELESYGNLKPDGITFIGVLTACCHAGLLAEAVKYFLLMKEKYNIEPSIKHYSCMVDLFGLIGLLEEAEELIRSMPESICPDVIIWGSLLAASVNHGNQDVATRAAQEMIYLDPSDTSAYVLMSNVHSASQQYENALQQRSLMRGHTTGKEPGCSSIEVEGEVHEFIAGGRSHPRVEEIYKLLEDIGKNLRE